MRKLKFGRQRILRAFLTSDQALRSVLLLMRSHLAALIVFGLGVPAAAPLIAGEIPPIGSHIPPGQRPSTMPILVWNSVFGATTPTGKRLSAWEIKPLVTSAAWPPSFPTRVGWHLQIGVFLLNVRPDGTVSSVEILQSTGQGFIDRGVIRAFAQWRFRPNSVKEVRIPAYYTVQRS